MFFRYILRNSNAVSNVLAKNESLLMKFKNNKNQVRCYCDKKDQISASGKNLTTGLRGIAGKYKVFRDFDSPIILDVDEERELQRTNPEQFEEVVSKIDPFAEINIEHGEKSVFKIEDLVPLLKMENAFNIVVISVPPEHRYVDFMVIVTGKSKKHIWALAEFIRGLYKRKRYEHEKIPMIEGDKETSWLAIDLGNIALHIFTKDARKHYDLELLWAVGHEYDDLVHQKDDSYIQLLEQHTHPSISGLTPTDA